jgi:hypothetical protein
LTNVVAWNCKLWFSTCKPWKCRAVCFFVLHELCLLIILNCFKPGWQIKADSAILHIHRRLGSASTLTKQNLF